METDAKPGQPVRVAVEGCGHGTLHAIYASVDEACRIQGWDGVDLVIIGGDFQAVRNKYDLNVTAMPPKFRDMRDFHEYYSGARVAPYPTIFIGGNHEASNHLFELYYGGWVAPNIYYLGAANILRFGPLRIAGLSGIWKGYDYNKPHFERLPYSDNDMHSVFHVREIDVRKLLSVQSQVDIGLSHDWPQGVEWFGDHEWLFGKRKDFAEDAQNGRLGSVAAKQCLDRLRPPHWFSAHLHTKYTAIIGHGEYQSVRPPRSMNASRPVQNITATQQTNGAHQNEERRRPIEPIDKPQVSAWQNFHVDAHKTDTEERDRLLQEQEKRKEEEARTGKREGPQYVFNETFKQVTTDDSFGRAVTSVSKADRSDSPQPISNLDGCGFSSPMKRKRRRSVSNPDAIDIDDSDGSETPLHSSKIPHGTFDGTMVESAPSTKVPVANPDAIDIDMSDDDDGEDSRLTETQESRKPDDVSDEVKILNGASIGREAGVSQSRLSSDQSNDGGTLLELELTNKDHKTDVTPDGVDAPTDVVNAEEEISEDMRVQLAQISSSFAPVETIEISPSLPLPEAITNKTTQFLALGKCEVYQEFLQLIEIAPADHLEEMPARPFMLSYDPEWLAILRVFAPELTLGGEPRDSVPQHRGDTYYHDRIMQEKKWIQENVVQAGLLEIPQNFTVTAPVYDPALKVETGDMPREVTNPQTSALCELIGIGNPFDITEEERDARVEQGPRPDGDRRGGFDGRGRGGRGGRGRGRGGRGARVGRR